MPPDSKQVFVRRMFDDIAGKYDFLNTVLSLGQDNRWRQRAIENIPDNGFVIDLCAGGGEMARQILSQKNFKGDVIITDISSNMLSLIKRNIPSVFNGCYYAVICDAQKLPFKNGTFSGAVSAFCLRNLSDLSAFTYEVKRVMQSGGLARHLEIAHPKNKLPASLFEFYFYRLSPLLARLFTSKSYAYRYLPNSLKTFPAQSEIAKILGEGWNESTFENIMGGLAAIYTLKKAEK